jgi:hypothetical protein
MKKFIVIGLALLITVPVLAAGIKATLVNPSGDKVVVEAGSVEAQKYFGKGYTLMGATVDPIANKCDELGALPGGRITQDVDIRGFLNYRGKINTTIATNTTLRIEDSGTTYYLASTTGSVLTLPPVARAAGVFYKFIIKGAFATSNFVIDSAEGDNIEGTLIVAGAVVDCDAEDQIDFVNDGENLGDYVEISSDGTKWFIGDSGALTGSKLTCTDPS